MDARSESSRGHLRMESLHGSVGFFAFGYSLSLLIRISESKKVRRLPNR